MPGGGVSGKASLLTIAPAVAGGVAGTGPRRDMDPTVEAAPVPCSSSLAGPKTPVLGIVCAGVGATAGSSSWLDKSGALSCVCWPTALFESGLMAELDSLDSDRRLWALAVGTVPKLGIHGCESMSNGLVITTAMFIACMARSESTFHLSESKRSLHLSIEQ